MMPTKKKKEVEILRFEALTSGLREKSQQTLRQLSPCTTCQDLGSIDVADRSKSMHGGNTTVNIGHQKQTSNNTNFAISVLPFPDYLPSNAQQLGRYENLEINILNPLPHKSTIASIA